MQEVQQSQQENNQEEQVPESKPELIADHNYKTTPESLRPFTYKTTKVKKLDSPIIMNGQKVRAIEVRKVAEYVDTYSGEIFTAKEAKALGLQEIDYGLLALRREAILGGLRKEVREFAMFVLKFRNKRRGVTPNAQELCRMYAELYNKRSDNVRRLLDTLKKKGILESDELLSPEFQISGVNTTAKDHLAEMFIAEITYEKLKREHMRVQ